MAWGKIIGGTLGAMFGGPIGAGIGVAIGAGIDDQEGQDALLDRRTPGAAGNLTLTQTGNVLRLTSMVRLPDEATGAFVRIAQRDRLLKSFVAHFSGEDDDFFFIKVITHQPLSIEIPLNVLSIERNEPQAIEAIVIILRENDEIGYLSAPDWIQVDFEPWSGIRWLAPAVDLLANYALRSGAWTPEKVRLIKTTFDGFINSDRDEFEALRERLNLHARPAVDECIDSCNRRFDFDEFAIEILSGVAGLLKLSGWAPRAVVEEIQLLGQRLHCQPDIIYEAKRRVAGDGGHARNDQSAGNSDVRWACGILGVEMGAGRDVVQSAWRRKISELHPDKYSNLPEVVQTMIKEKAQELNRAREILTKRNST